MQAARSALREGSNGESAGRFSGALCFRVRVGDDFFAIAVDFTCKVRQANRELPPIYVGVDGYVVRHADETGEVAVGQLVVKG